MTADERDGSQLEEAILVGPDVGEVAGAHRAGMATVGVNADANARADSSTSSLPELLTRYVALRGMSFRVP